MKKIKKYCKFKFNFIYRINLRAKIVHENSKCLKLIENFSLSYFLEKSCLRQ